MNWTTTAPTEPGWYWFKPTPYAEPEAAHYFTHQGYPLLGRNNSSHLVSPEDYKHARWGERIPEPKE